jgi:hypothetical protein
MGQPSLFRRPVISFRDFEICFVDFASQTARLKANGKHSMIGLFKGVVLLGALVGFFLGAFAVSFAARDSAASWPLVTVGLSRVPAQGATQLTPDALRLGVGFDTDEVPNSPRLDAKDVRLARTSVAEPIAALSKSFIYTAKVSLQIFELVLLL